MLSPNRFDSRPTWVSTGRPGRPNATLRTTLPVLRPTPGKRHQILQLGRHLSIEAIDQRLGHSDQALRLVLVEAGRANDLLDVGRIGRGQTRPVSGTA